jgi:hypothetical protein
LLYLALAAPSHGGVIAVEAVQELHTGEDVYNSQFKTIND